MFDLPLGFGYALAQNVRAKDYFMSKSEQEQKEMIHRAQQLQSDEEMLRYVEGLAKKNDAPIPVSYTHLDVYKRQRKYKAIFNKN